MEKIKQRLTSYKTSIVLLLVYAFLMALATFIEKWMNTTAAKILIYYSPLFILLQLLLVANFVLALLEHRFISKRKWALVVIHAALIVILGGALTTHIFGREGTMHIREGERSNAMVMHTSKGVKNGNTAFFVGINRFQADPLSRIDQPVVLRERPYRAYRRAYAASKCIYEQCARPERLPFFSGIV